MSKLTIAFAKGRMQYDALRLMSQAGIKCSAIALDSRRLVIDDESGQYRFIFVKPVDVPIYVEHGIADCGVVGRDVLWESDADLLQPLDLQIGRCRLVVAAPVDAPPLDPYALRVATKYPRITMKYFGDRAVAVEIIELSGSVELAPILGLADCIVDVVETGQTLKENGLAVIDVVAASSGRLVVNRASYQLKAVAVNYLLDALSKVVAEEDFGGRMIEASSRMIA